MVDQAPSNAPACLLLYDGECPVCSTFARFAEGEGAGQLAKVDARKPSELLQKATAAALDLDYGVVLAAEGKLFYGADVLVHLARRGSTGWRSWLYRPFRSRRVAHLLYPPLVRLRWLMLWLGRKSLIRNLAEAEERPAPPKPQGVNSLSR